MRKVADLRDLPLARAVAVEVDGKTILLVRDGDAVRALAGKCPHAGAPLAEGAVCDGRLVCPWHKATFRLADGAPIEPPALDGLARYPVRIDGGGAVFVSAEALPAASSTKPAPPDARTFLIVGGGAAGCAAASALREFGFAGRLVMVGREPGPPYDRTALSKFVMEGGMAPDEVPPLRDEAFLDEHRIERMIQDVTRLDAAARRATLADGRAIAYDAALVAPGASPRSLDVPGGDLPGVLALRSRADAAAIVAEALPGRRVVIVGGSFIGLEVASGLTKKGLRARVVARDEVPFARQFGAAIGGMVRDLHAANGVAFHAGRSVTRIEGEARARRVVLDDGTALDADLVVVGIGVRPATGFVTGAEIGEDGGIAVDAGMRAAEGLFAAGDVARFPYRGAPIRVEHWRVAQQHARIAARGMTGGVATYDGVPFFWTYHFGKRIEYLGHAEDWDETIVNGDLGSQRFIALLARGGEVRAVVACQRETETAAMMERMRAPLSVPEAERMIGAP